ncbi:MAG: hypothetical protein ACW981_06735 [Candidatus Hodarchaeales archaeon]|jgi:hypothetical protein
MITQKYGKYFIFTLIFVVVALNITIFYVALGFELPDIIGGENLGNDKNFPFLTWSHTFNWDKDSLQSMIPTSDGGFLLLGNIRDSDSRFIWLLKISIEGSVEWNRTISNLVSSSVIETSDNGFVIFAGPGFFIPENFVQLIKTDKNGNILWTETFTEYSTRGKESLIETSDGGLVFLITKTNESSENDVDTLMIKLDRKGNEVWTQIYGSNKTEIGSSIIELSDNYLLIAGRTEYRDINSSTSKSDIWLVKTDQAGEKQWEKTIETYLSPKLLDPDEKRENFPAFFVHSSIITTSDSGFLISGSGSGYAYSDIIMVKTDANGNKEWDRNYFSALECGPTRLYSTIDLFNGDYLITGLNTVNKPDLGWERNGILLKIFPDGTIDWVLNLGKFESYGENSIQETSNGKFVIAGTIHGETTNNNLWIGKIDTNLIPENALIKSDCITFPESLLAPNYFISFTALGIISVFSIICSDYFFGGKISRAKFKQFLKKAQTSKIFESRGINVILALSIILILDELWLIGINIPTNRMLGDLSMFHIEPIHHFQIGIAIIILLLFKLLYNSRKSTN